MIFPFQTLHYTTSLRTEEVVSKLRDNVGEPPKWFKRPPQPYLGHVNDRTFKIYRNITGYNSFLPFLRGQIESSSEGSELRVRFDIHPAIVVFFLVLVVFALTAFTSADGAGLAFALFMLVLFSAGFFPEASRAKSDLKKLIPPTPEVTLHLSQPVK